MPVVQTYILSPNPSGPPQIPELRMVRGQTTLAGLNTVQALPGVPQNATCVAQFDTTTNAGTILNAKMTADGQMTITSNNAADASVVSWIVMW